MTAADTLSFDVKVTNTGDVAGKEVVQLYYSAPYTKGGIEKAAVNLGDFAKTGLLEPGKSKTVRVSIEVKDMASYDYETDKTYVLDSGDYTISIAKNAHEAAAGAENAFDYNLSAKTKCDTAVTGNKVTNQLDEVTEGYEKNYNGLSRADFAATMPDAPAKNLTLTAEEYDGYSFDIGDYDEFYTEEQLADLKYATTTEGRAEKYKTVLSDLIGAEADDPRFQDMVEQLTIDELVDYINNGGFHSLAIDYLGVPYAHNTDGPKGWTGSGKKLQFMDPVDIYTLLGNALDNAVESVMRIEYKDRKVINFSISEQGEIVLIRTDNYYEGKIEFKNGMPLTSKSNKFYHGFGMDSMRRIVEKYDGSIAVGTKAGIFTLQMVIPVPYAEEGESEGENGNS